MYFKFEQYVIAEKRILLQDDYFLTFRETILSLMCIITRLVILKKNQVASFNIADHITLL